MVEEELKKDLVPPPTSVLVVDQKDWGDDYCFPSARIAEFVKNCPTF